MENGSKHFRPLHGLHIRNGNSQTSVAKAGNRGIEIWNAAKSGLTKQVAKAIAGTTK